MSEVMERVIAAQNDARKVTERVLKEVLGERARQWSKWGLARGRGTDESDPTGYVHDDEHTPGDWTRFIVRHLGRAEQAIEDGHPYDWRESMLRVAALAVAAIESHDRSDRRG